jgi:hypothetical protein
LPSGRARLKPYFSHDPLDFSFYAKYVFCRVRKLPEVDEAKALMIEAMEWSVFTWLFHKGRVRETADRANAVLDRLNHSVKAHWSEEVKTAYKRLAAGRHRPVEVATDPVDPEIALFVTKVKEADDAARRARKDAERIFDEAERQLNTGLAREGCKKAIHQWELDEKAIRKAEAVPSPRKAAS